MAAGLGFKTFTTGEVLTAGDTNGYLMQGVLVFASAAARTSAITSPQEGQVSYLKDTDATEYYNGSSWTSLGGLTSTFFAGKNKIVNADFFINQRSFTSNTTTGAYNFDRWLQQNSGGTFTVTPQTFTPGTAPVVGYEAANFVRGVTATQSAAGDYAIISQRIEDVRTMAGTTATISFWAKANTGTPKIGIELSQNFGAGGSPSSAVSTPVGSITLTTSWVRYSASVSIPSISGKTIGTTANSSYLELNLWTSSGATNATRASSIGIQNFTADIWGVQLEAGSSATSFVLAGGGSEQPELALSQRYYFRTQTGTSYGVFGVTVAGGTTTTYANVIMKQTMRTTPASVDYSGLKWQAINNSANISAASISDATPENVLLVCTTTGATAGAMNYLAGQSSAAYVGFSAEL